MLVLCFPVCFVFPNPGGENQRSVPVGMLVVWSAGVQRKLFCVQCLFWSFRMMLVPKISNRNPIHCLEHLGLFCFSKPKARRKTVLCRVGRRAIGSSWKQLEQGWRACHVCFDVFARILCPEVFNRCPHSFFCVFWFCFHVSCSESGSMLLVWSEWMQRAESWCACRTYSIMPGSMFCLEFWVGLVQILNTPQSNSQNGHQQRDKFWNLI